MKLYYSKGACSLAVRITLHEIGLPCDFEAVNLGTKQTKSGLNFLTINPKGSVPALALDDKQVLTENATIQQYLAEKYHAQTMLPTALDMPRYRTLEWLNFVATELHKGFSPFFNPNIPQEIKNTVFLPALKKKIDHVETQLKNNHYIAGDNFTIADSYLFTILSWSPVIHLNLTDWPSTNQYVKNLQLRPSVHQALQEEHLIK